MGCIYLIGMGPGNLENMTDYAKLAIEDSDIIMGYKFYIDLIGPLISKKDVEPTGVEDELERGEKAIKLALAGKKVAIVSSGDSAVYGMAGIVFEIMAAHNYDIGIKVIPGITAINSAASLLGVPLMNDFCSISLSDRLTPESTVLKRVKAAVDGDFVIGFYNPASKKRTQIIKKAIEILLKYREADTPVGIIKNAYRNGQEARLAKLGNILNESIDMFTIIIIGNSETFAWKNFMITPRNYDTKYKL
ncbi:MAG: precorrin-3B C(17)-methyltransferase [Ferroplasma sp.]